MQIGALAGTRIALDAALLRSSDIVIMGSGVGSIDPALLLQEIPKILALAADGGIELPMRVGRLADVDTEWATTDRLVLVP